MSTVYSNYLKVMLIAGNVLDSNNKFSQSDCMTVQRFDYNFERTCNSNGVPFGVTINPVVEFTVKFMSELKAKSFFSKISSINNDEYSFLFNTSFDGNRAVDSYENAIVVRGYVVEVEQVYVSVEKMGENQQMELNIKILASDVTYAGSLANKTLYISKI